MRGRTKKTGNDDSNSWIAYTDLLTTLLTFFVVVAFVGAARVRSLEAAAVDKAMRAELHGRVFDAASRQPLAGYTVRLASAQTRTASDGRFFFSDLDLSAETQPQLIVGGANYETYSEKISLVSGFNSVTIYLLKTEQTPEGELKVEMLDGDAYFEVSRAEIKPGAMAELTELGKRFRESLLPDEIIVVQGHTDDQPFRLPGKSNWELSGERAAAVCRVFQEAKYGVNISGKQLIAMGYGEFRPQVAVEAFDDPGEAETKRARNRRIEIRKLKGAVFSANKL